MLTEQETADAIEEYNQTQETARAVRLQARRAAHANFLTDTAQAWRRYTGDKEAADEVYQTTMEEASEKLREATSDET